jgi:hypothetical protein
MFPAVNKVVLKYIYKNLFLLLNFKTPVKEKREVI